MGQTQGFKVRVGVVLMHRNNILLVRQNNRDFWVFPGGTLEPGESMGECAVREIQEECNLEIEAVKLLYVADFITAERQAIDVFFLGRILSGEFRLTEEENINEGGFYPLEALHKMLVAPPPIAHQVLKDAPGGFEHASGQYLGRYGLIAF